jgi:hypothetical protein
MTMRTLQTSFINTPPDGELDLDDPETNFMAMMKIRGDLAEKDFFFGFPGIAWAMVPQEQNYRCFKTFGLGAARIEKAPEGWRYHSREVLLYMDPDTGEIISEWTNPFLGNRTVEVMHIANDPVNGIFSVDGSGVLAAPYPYVAYGDDIVFQWDFYIMRPADMTRTEYPLYSAGNMEQHAELWGIHGRKSDVLNPDITSGQCVMSWSRVASWLPFMEMGNKPGQMIFQSQAVKLMGGPQDLPRYVLDYLEKNYPSYLSAPTEWNGPEMRSSYEAFREKIEAQREAGD